MKQYIIHINNNLYSVISDGYIISDDSFTFYLKNKVVFIAFKKSIDCIDVKNLNQEI